tara:strand:- start:98 stop:4870 length:4773 start_codon:yes stop_codon:yes gene_type:complete
MDPKDPKSILSSLNRPLDAAADKASAAYETYLYGSPQRRILDELAKRERSGDYEPGKPVAQTFFGDAMRRATRGDYDPIKMLGRAKYAGSDREQALQAETQRAADRITQPDMSQYQTTPADASAEYMAKLAQQPAEPLPPMADGPSVREARPEEMYGEGSMSIDEFSEMLANQETAQRVLGQAFVSGLMTEQQAAMMQGLARQAQRGELDRDELKGALDTMNPMAFAATEAAFQGAGEVASKAAIRGLGRFARSDRGERLATGVRTGLDRMGNAAATFDDAVYRRLRPERFTDEGGEILMEGTTPRRRMPDGEMEDVTPQYQRRPRREREPERARPSDGMTAEQLEELELEEAAAQARMEAERALGDLPASTGPRPQRTVDRDMRPQPRQPTPDEPTDMFDEASQPQRETPDPRTVTPFNFVEDIAEDLLAQYGDDPTVMDWLTGLTAEQGADLVTSYDLPPLDAERLGATADDLPEDSLDPLSRGEAPIVESSHPLVREVYYHVDRGTDLYEAILHTAYEELVSANSDTPEFIELLNSVRAVRAALEEAAEGQRNVPEISDIDIVGYIRARDEERAGLEREEAAEGPTTLNDLLNDEATLAAVPDAPANFRELNERAARNALAPDDSDPLDLHDADLNADNPEDARVEYGPEVRQLIEDFLDSQSTHHGYSPETMQAITVNVLDALANLDFLISRGAPVTARELVDQLRLNPELESDYNLDFFQAFQYTLANIAPGTYRAIHETVRPQVAEDLAPFFSDHTAPPTAGPHLAGGHERAVQRTVEAFVPTSLARNADSATAYPNNIYTLSQVYELLYDSPDQRTINPDLLRARTQSSFGLSDAETEFLFDAMISPAVAQDVYSAVRSPAATGENPDPALREIAGEVMRGIATRLTNPIRLTYWVDAMELATQLFGLSGEELAYLPSFAVRGAGTPTMLRALTSNDNAADVFAELLTDVHPNLDVQVFGNPPATPEGPPTAGTLTPRQTLNQVVFGNPQGTTPTPPRTGQRPFVDDDPPPIDIASTRETPATETLPPIGQRQAVSDTMLQEMAREGERFVSPTPQPVVRRDGTPVLDPEGNPRMSTKGLSAKMQFIKRLGYKVVKKDSAKIGKGAIIPKEEGEYRPSHVRPPVILQDEMNNRILPALNYLEATQGLDSFTAADILRAQDAVPMHFPRHRGFGPASFANETFVAKLPDFTNPKYSAFRDRLERAPSTIEGYNDMGGISRLGPYGPMKQLIPSMDRSGMPRLQTYVRMYNAPANEMMTKMRQAFAPLTKGDVDYTELAELFNAALTDRDIDSYHSYRGANVANNQIKAIQKVANNMAELTGLPNENDQHEDAFSLLKTLLTDPRYAAGQPMAGYDPNAHEHFEDYVADLRQRVDRGEHPEATPLGYSRAYSTVHPDLPGLSYVPSETQWDPSQRQTKYGAVGSPLRAQRPIFVDTPITSIRQRHKLVNREQLQQAYTSGHDYFLIPTAEFVNTATYIEFMDMPNLVKQYDETIPEVYAELLGTEVDDFPVVTSPKGDHRFYVIPLNEKAADELTAMYFEEEVGDPKVSQVLGKLGPLFALPLAAMPFEAARRAMNKEEEPSREN